MGARNSGQLRLNFGTAILIDSDYQQAIFEQKTPKRTRGQKVAIWSQN